MKLTWPTESTDLLGCTDTLREALCQLTHGQGRDIYGTPFVTKLPKFTRTPSTCRGLHGNSSWSPPLLMPFEDSSYLSGTPPKAVPFEDSSYLSWTPPKAALFRGLRQPLWTLCYTCVCLRTALARMRKSDRPRVTAQEYIVVRTTMYSCAVTRGPSDLRMRASAVRKHIHV